MNDMKYMYLRSHRNAGVVCIGSRKITKNIVEYAVRYCSPKDQFVKKTAHKLLSEYWMRVVEVDKMNHPETKWAILLDIAHNRDYPSWADMIIKDHIFSLAFRNTVL